MAIYVSGSLAFDRIMSFNGNFKDHILMDKLHMLNVSFMVDKMEVRRGGTAGNIAFSLALLGERPIIVSSAGADFDDYGKELERLGLSLAGIRRVFDLFTALCYITTDLEGNQFTGFYPGAMNEPADYAFPNINPERDIAIVSPGNVEDMRRLPKFYREQGIPYIFDPGQQLPVLSKEDLIDALDGSLALISNDYELNLISKATGLARNDLLKKTGWLVTTLGGEGARIRNRDGFDQGVCAIQIDKVVDPTGAGDAQRAGLLKGLAMGLPMLESVRLGSVTASYAIERMGTQEHEFDMDDFRKRYESAYGPMPEV